MREESLETYAQSAMLTKLLYTRRSHTNTSASPEKQTPATQKCAYISIHLEKAGVV